MEVIKLQPRTANTNVTNARMQPTSDLLCQTNGKLNCGQNHEEWRKKEGHERGLSLAKCMHYGRIVNALLKTGRPLPSWNLTS